MQFLSKLKKGSRQVLIAAAAAAMLLLSMPAVQGQVAIQGRFANLVQLQVDYDVVQLPFLDNKVLEDQERHKVSVEQLDETETETPAAWRLDGAIEKGTLRKRTLFETDGDDDVAVADAEKVQAEEGMVEQVEDGDEATSKPLHLANVDPSPVTADEGPTFMASLMRQFFGDLEKFILDDQKHADANTAASAKQQAERAGALAAPPAGSGPFTFGRELPVHLDIDTHGTWTDLPDGQGRVWRLGLKSPSALSLNLLFDRFYLPEGAELYVRGESSTLGAFTAAINNNPYMQFSTTPLPGSSLVLEYFEPANTRDRVLLRLESVVHGFRPLTDLPPIDGNAARLDASGACNVNVACQEALKWVNQTRSVAVMMTSRGQKFCSGAMINNALRDGKQYFLTAYHCVEGDPSVSRYNILGFNYQSSVCANTGRTWPLNQTAAGMILKARNRWSDFALFEVVEKIPDAYNVYLAGWSNSKKSPSKAFGVHHPSGDIKKISFYNDVLARACWDECSIGNYHWRVAKWSRGTTEPGSSGSPLFSADDGCIVGQLHGGTASCYNTNGYDEYGALYASYNISAVPTQQLKAWLNPANNPAIVRVRGEYLKALRKDLK